MPGMRPGRRNMWSSLHALLLFWAPGGPWSVPDMCGLTTNLITFFRQSSRKRRWDCMCRGARGAGRASRGGAATTATRACCCTACSTASWGTRAGPTRGTGPTRPPGTCPPTGCWRGEEHSNYKKIHSDFSYSSTVLMNDGIEKLFIRFCPMKSINTTSMLTT